MNGLHLMYFDMKFKSQQRWNSTKLLHCHAQGPVSGAEGNGNGHVHLHTVAEMVFNTTRFVLSPQTDTICHRLGVLKSTKDDFVSWDALDMSTDVDSGELDRTMNPMCWHVNKCCFRSDSSFFFQMLFSPHAAKTISRKWCTAKSNKCPKGCIT